MTRRALNEIICLARGCITSRNWFAFLLRNEHNISCEFHVFIGDIIHLIGYYPNRVTTTTQRPLYDNSNKPFYQYPQSQNDWNYESNHIQHGASQPSYPTYHSPISSSSSNQKPQNNYNNYNGYGGYQDDSGYLVTASPIVSGNDYNRPQATPSRPLSTNGYQQPDYDEGFSYGSYQGIKRIWIPQKYQKKILSTRWMHEARVQKSSTSKTKKI